MKKHIGIIGIVILLTSCWGEVYCPAFPESKLNWIPYQENMSVRFSCKNDTIEFSIENTYKTDSYFYKKICDCICESSAGFKTNIEQELKIEGHGIYYDEIRY